jgi:hypothetical protein
MTLAADSGNSWPKARLIELGDRRAFEFIAFVQEGHPESEADITEDGGVLRPGDTCTRDSSRFDRSPLMKALRVMSADAAPCGDRSSSLPPSDRWGISPSRYRLSIVGRDNSA